jgi:xanthine dehydrogenase accessory factor
VSGPLFAALRAAILAGEPVVLATVTEVGPEAAGATRLGAKVVVRPGQGSLGSLGEPELDRVVERDALGALDLGVTTTRHYGPAGESRRDDVAVFLEVFAPPSRIVIFGAVDFTRALVEVAKVLGFHVTVCDARPVFATRKRFPFADEVVAEWPDHYLEREGPALGPRDAVCVLTHDAKFDVPAVLGALATSVGYLGAMGSRRTHAERLRRLVEAGADATALAERLMSPIGLDIGARTPEETAVAICAEIIALRSGRAGRPVVPLRDESGPIHHG